jgi:tetratricopeptide (TPR) repeat protein
MVAARLARLDGPARRAFAAVCVIGTECGARLIAEVTGETREASLAALDLLLERRLLRATDDGRGYAVEHPLIQRTVYEELSPGRRQDWHRRTAAALERLAGDLSSRTAGQVLHHLLAADAPPDDVIRAAELAGDHALQHSAFADAIERYATARKLLSERLPDPAARAGYARLGERLAEALAGAGRWSEATTLYEELIAATATPLDHSRLRRKLAAVLGDVLGRFDEAFALLDAAEAELAGVDDPDVELGRIAGTRTIAHFFRSNYRAVVEHGERALALWQGRTGIERDEIELIMRIGQAEQRLGMLDEAETRYRTAGARANALGDRRLQAASLSSLGPILMHRGRMALALETHERAAQIGAELGIRRIELVGLTNRANTLQFIGRLAEAREGFEAVVRLAESLDARYTVMHATVGLGSVLVQLGVFDQARLTLARGIELAGKIGNQQRRGHAELHMAELALLEGDPRAARCWAERGMATGRAIDDFHTVREGCPLLAEALAELGENEAALKTARHGLNVAASGGFVLSAARNQLALCRALAYAGRLPETEAALLEAERVFRESDARFDLARTLLLRAGLEPREDVRATALDESTELARRSGSRALIELTAQARHPPV